MNKQITFLYRVTDDKGNELGLAVLVTPSAFLYDGDIQSGVFASFRGDGSSGLFVFSPGKDCLMKAASQLNIILVFGLS